MSLENADLALRLLEAACRPTDVAPQIVPGISGDLQIEWHLPGGDIELHVRDADRVHAWRENASTPEGGEEIELTDDFKVVADWIRDLVARRIGVEASAA